MIQWTNMLLVAGTNRNVGKTTFACNLIEQLSKKQQVVAIKITPHIHELCASCNILYKSANLTITEESGSDTGKDSSKMLAAGAQRVFYVQGADAELDKIVDYIKPLIANSVAVVCESASLRKVVDPGMFVVMSRSISIVKNIDKIPLADFHIIDFKYDICEIYFEDGRWKK